MDLFKADPDEVNMMDVDPWLSVPETSGFDDPAEALFPSASPAPSLPGSSTMQGLVSGSSLQQQARPQQPQAWQQQHRQQASPGLPPWPGMGQPQPPHPQQMQVPPHLQHLQQQQQHHPQGQHMWQLPPGGLHLQQQQQPQLKGMVPVPQQGVFPGLPPQQQQQMQMQRMQQMLAQQRQFQQMPPQMRMQLMQQQQHMMMQARHSDSMGGSGSNPPSAPGSPRAGQLSRQNSMQDRQVSTSSAGGAHPAKLDAAALLAVAAPKPRKKQQSGSSAPREGGGVGNKKAAAAAAAAAAAYTALWKHTGPPREPRVPREGGIEYEEILPPGLVVANTRPLPLPAELFQLSSLSEVLNLDSWQNELDDADRATLRALLPNKGKGFSEEAGGHLDALLSGTENICFGNPTAQLWEVLSSGAAAPRVRRQQELLLQIKQQLAAVALRSYHNQQVSMFLAMQRLWDATLPPDAPMSARLAAWSAAKSGEMDVPDSPRAAVQAAWAHEMSQAAEPEQQRDGQAGEKQQHESAAAAERSQVRQGYGQRVGGQNPAQQQGATGGRGARGQQQGVVVGSTHGDFVYETGVNFSQHMTKRQQAALAQQQQPQAAAAMPAPQQAPAQSAQQQQQQLLQQLQQVQQMQQQQQQAAVQARAVAGTVPTGQQGTADGAPTMQLSQQQAGVRPAGAPQQLQYRMAAQQLQLQQAAMQAQQQQQQQLQQQVRSQLQQLPLQQQQQLQQLLMQRQAQLQQQQHQQQ